jgi:hypothetical protein
MVVIRIGRNLTLQASKSPVTFGLKREIDQHDAVLFHEADQENNPDQPDDVELTSGSSIALPRSFWPSGSAPGTARGSDRR